MEAKVNRREWVKNVAIIFLAVLLVLTFFSNTIRNRSLPEVATQMVQSNSITAKVRGTGTVEAAGIYEVKSQQTRLIKAVMVRAGQSVEAGDVLFVLGEGPSEELQAAQEQLDALQKSLQTASISAPSYDYTEQEKAILKAEELVAQLQSEEAAAKLLYEANNPNYASRLDIANKELEQANQKLTEAIEDYCRELPDSEKDIDVAALTEELPAQNDSYEVLDKAISDARTNVGIARNNLNVAQQELEALGELDDKTEAQEKVNQAQLALSSELGKLESAKLNKLKKAYDQVQAALAQRQSVLESGGPEIQDYLTAITEREAAEESLESLRHSLEQQKISDGKSSALTGLELNELRKQINKQKELINELSGGVENQIVAPVAGEISEICYTAGQNAPAGEILCMVEVPDMGYTMTITVTSDQAKRIRVGDEGTVTNYYWGSTITAQVNSIRNDPKDPQKSRLVTLDVYGDTNAGATLTVAIGSRSMDYDNVVPNNAIRSDSNGSFVLLVEAKNSPLGNNYYARRTPVEVIASDDFNSAVTGEFNWGDYVITTSTAPVSNGDMVRMADGQNGR